jgi:hypothetical protein
MNAVIPSVYPVAILEMIHGDAIVGLPYRMLRAAFGEIPTDGCAARISTGGIEKPNQQVGMLTEVAGIVESLLIDGDVWKVTGTGTTNISDHHRDWWCLLAKDG